MQDVTQTVIRDATGLVDKVRARLVRRHMFDISVLFVCAGLTIAFVPLAAGKLRLQAPFLSSILPTITVVVTFLLGLAMAWGSRPTRDDAARVLDKHLQSKELFLTAIHLVPQHCDATMLQLFSEGRLRDLTATVKATEVLPSRVAPTLKFLLALLVVDGLLIATPMKAIKKTKRVTRIQDHITVALDQNDEASDEEKAELESLKNARDAKELEARARVIWKDIQNKKRLKKEQIEKAIESLADALKHKSGVDEAKNRLSRLLNSELDSKTRESLAKRLKELDEQNKGAGLKALLPTEKDRGQGVGTGAASAGDAASSKATAEREDKMRDLLMSVFNGLGVAPPDIGESDQSAAITDTSRSAPKKPDGEYGIRSLKLKESERAIIRSYLELRAKRLEKH